MLTVLPAASNDQAAPDRGQQDPSPAKLLLLNTLYEWYRDESLDRYEIEITKSEVESRAGENCADLFGVEKVDDEVAEKWNRQMDSFRELLERYQRASNAAEKDAVLEGLLALGFDEGAAEIVLAQCESPEGLERYWSGQIYDIDPDQENASFRESARHQLLNEHIAAAAAQAGETGKYGSFLKWSRWRAPEIYVHPSSRGIVAEWLWGDPDYQGEWRER